MTIEFQETHCLIRSISTQRYVNSFHVKETKIKPVIFVHYPLLFLFSILQERGAEKEVKFVTELVHKQMEEERARIPRANPYPYTTDYPVVKVNSNVVYLLKLG